MLTSIFFHLDTLFHKSIPVKTKKEIKKTFLQLKRHQVSIYLLTSHKEILLSTFLFSDEFSCYITDVFQISSYKETYLYISSLETLLAQYSLPKSELLLFTDNNIFANAAFYCSIACIGYNKNNTISFVNTPMVVEEFTHLSYNYFSNALLRFWKQPITITKTKRLILREFCEADFFQLYQLYQNKHVTQYLINIPKDFSEFQNIYKNYIEHIYPFYDMGFWGIFYVQKDKEFLIGQCGIQPKEMNGKTEIELGYLLHPDFQQKGFASEAVLATLRYARYHLHLSSLVAVISKDNTPSLKLIKRIGFHFEKTIFYENTEQLLYRMPLENFVFPKAELPSDITKEVYEKIQRNPNTSVYGKRYH